MVDLDIEDRMSLSEGQSMIAIQQSYATDLPLVTESFKNLALRRIRKE